MKTISSIFLSLIGAISINSCSGTFWFDAVNSTGEKVEIREGRFDMHYVN